MIITRTPFRLPLGGGGTDLPSFYSKHGGFVFNVAINKYMYISINTPIVDKLIRLHYSSPEIVDDVSMIQHPLVREALKMFKIKNGIEIAAMADVPAGTGLGSSSSFLVGLLKGIHALKRCPVAMKDLAEEACRIEIETLKKPIGKQDQYAAAFGGFLILEFLKKGSVKVTQANIPDEALERLNQNMLLFYTGTSRDALSILGEQSIEAKKPGSYVERALLQIKDIGLEIKQQLEQGNVDRFGWLLHEHWKAKKGISKKISSEHMDNIYRLARKNGATGGKIVGAGGGGFFMFYCPGQKRKLREVMSRAKLLEMKYTFDYEGSKILVNFLSYGPMVDERKRRE